MESMTFEAVYRTYEYMCYCLGSLRCAGSQACLRTVWRSLVSFAKEYRPLLLHNLAFELIDVSERSIVTAPICIFRDMLPRWPDGEDPQPWIDGLAAALREVLVRGGELTFLSNKFKLQRLQFLHI